MAKIFLCGFMAAGKTHTARRLADELSYSFYDLDKIIIDNESTTIYNIFITKGEEYFRTLETKYLINLIKEDNIVVALGGGTVLARENVELIKDNNGIIIFIDTDIESILERIKHEEKRPLLKKDGPKKAKELYYERLPIYKDVSDYQTKSVDIKDILNLIEKEL